MRGRIKGTAVVATGVVACVLAAGCGDDDSAEADGLPQFVSGYADTCSDGTGFDGAAAFEPGPGALPLAFFTDLDDEGTLFLIDPGLGDDVAVVELSDPDDDAERARLAEISAVACLDVETSEPSGATCDFEDDDGDVTTLDVLDVTYALEVYEAKTGAEIDTASLEVAGADEVCPIVLSIDEGQTTMLPSPEPEDVTAALESIVGA